MAVVKEEEQPAQLGAPVASTSQLPSSSDVKPNAVRSSSPDAKGKGRALPDDDSPAVKDEESDDIAEPDVKLDPDERILFGAVPKANIVGLKYYRGIQTLKEGMAVEIKRDPYNVNDSNAIEVRHMRGQRIGYMSKELSAKLAPLVKERKIDFRGVAGPVGLFKTPFRLEIWGKRKFSLDPRLDWLFPERMERKRVEKERKKALEQARKEADDADEGEKGGVRDSKQNDRDIAMRQSILLDKGKKVDLLGSIFQEGGNDPALLPSHPSPPGKKDGSMKSNLLPFQRQGLAWMIRMEHPQLPKSVDDPPVQLWTKKEDTAGKIFWHNVGTNTTQREKPILKRGGILADEMGLGKTMQTIALICTDDTGEGVLDEPEDPDERFDDMTLIVCPLSVASNWTEQLQQHVGKKRLSWHFYHGEGRELSKKELRDQTIIGGLDESDSASSSRKGSHGTAENGDETGEAPDEMGEDGEPARKKQKRSKNATLHAIKWRRVVLDEGHLIKNPKAKMTRACLELKAEVLMTCGKRRRWILSGTPIVNASGDLGTMVQFLRVCKPLDQPAVWKQYVASGSDEGRNKLLRAVVSSTTLRRTKDMFDPSGKPLVQLPSVERYMHEIDLKDDVRELYDEIEAEIGKSVKSSLKEQGGKTGYTHILCLLLRLRQVACDPSLVPGDFIEDLRDRKLAARIQRDHERAIGLPTSGKGPVSAEQLDFVRSLLREAIEAGADCLACGRWAEDPRITICQHVFCQSCIESAVDAKAACPSCNNPLKREHIISLPAFRSVSPYSSARSSSVGTSRHGSAAPVERTAKVEALVRLLKSSAPGVKSLVFSQWTTHLDRIEAALHAEGIATCRFDGSMRQDKREAVIKLFTQPNRDTVAGDKGDRKNPMVMLLSLKAGALGLNLTVASQVFLMDPWWQESIEAQAIDRVNRIGQTQAVRVFQLVAKNTIEARVLTIQEKKQQLIQQAFSGNKNAPKRQAKIELTDLASLFNISV
ncbi:hypothetical protein Rhopal_003896-T1 [Rhodotorula paludigena]|uniref:Uncharacterized protein n=1 Tax=Rhodotorula paludigena TaxID=86838 RepID=A0AAV5GNE0_9BASI|nr:hypothetical protein Rhopal_003896-T1 [Rhodotorula paludigena]